MVVIVTDFAPKARAQEGRSDSFKSYVHVTNLWGVKVTRHALGAGGWPASLGPQRPATLET